MIAQIEPNKSAETAAQDSRRQSTRRTRKTRYHPRDPLKNLGDLPPLEFSEIDTSALENLAQSASAAPAPVARPPADGQPAETSPAEEPAKVPPPGARNAPSPEPGATVPEVTVGHLHNSMMPSFFLSAVRKLYGDGVKPITVQQYRDEMIDSCGARNDPLASSLIEGVATMRFTHAYLQARIIDCSVTSELAVLTAAACQVAAEMRRCVQALQAFGEKKGHTAT